MPGLARILILLGVVLVIAGVLVYAFGRLNLPIGRLPGDMTWRGRNWSVSFPLASSLVISILLSLLLWFVGRIRR